MSASALPAGVNRYRWRDLVPPIALDLDPARASVRSALEGSAGRGDHDALEDAIDRGIQAEYGVWSSGWRWGASEPGGGGLVQNWCCAQHSLRASTAMEHVPAALEDWWRCLTDLARRFQAIRGANEGLPRDRAAARAAAELLPWVVERTDANDAWYSTFATVMTWYLESAGDDAAVVKPMIDRLVRGVFESWCAPDDEVARSACEDLGRVVGSAQPRAPIDGLSAWLTIRGKCFAPVGETCRRTTVEADGHLRFIDGPERARDAARATRMAAALEACRANALAGGDLDFARLARWQSLVLGAASAPFRHSDAFAKGGAERYPIAADTAERFDAILRETADASLPGWTRAARAYLDVCFFHPFDDGNGRAARLALDYVLTQEGLALHTIEPIVLLPRDPSDGNGAWWLARLVNHLAGFR